MSLNNKQEMFKNTTRTYKTRENALKVIDGLEDGYYRYLIGVNDKGRFFPIVILDRNGEFNHHYFINKGCCVIVQ